MDLSLPAWLGAFAGTICAALIHPLFIRALELRLRAGRGPQTLEQRAESEAKLSVVRRSILAVEIAMLATLGYWIGGALGSAAPARF
jgi:hypothetical protein